MKYSDNNKLTVINLWGGPNSGKSTNAAGLFHLMKLEYISSELVTEYAKALVWSERGNMFTEQDYIFAKQNHALRRLVGKVKFAITDSPLALSVPYIPSDYPTSFKAFVLDVFNTYNNINIYIKRRHRYDPVGRNQTEEQAKQIDVELKQVLEKYKIPHITVESSENTSKEIFEILREKGYLDDDSV